MSEPNFDDLFDEGHIEQIHLNDESLLEIAVVEMEAGGGILGVLGKEFAVFSLKVTTVDDVEHLLVFHEHLAKELLIHLMSYGSGRAASFKESAKEREE